MAAINPAGSSHLSGLAGQPIMGPFDGVDFNDLERSLRRPRTFTNILLTWIVSGMTLVALVPLFSVIWMLSGVAARS